MPGAVVWTRAPRAIISCVPRLAVACAVVANASIRAVIQAGRQRAVVTNPSLVARTGEVLTAAVPRAIVGADHSLGAVGAAPALNAVARTVPAEAVPSAVRHARSHVTSISLPPG